jgi:cytochrome c551
MKYLLIILGSIFVFAACSSSTSSSENEATSETESSEDAVKKKQYLVAGETLFLQYCSNCHQQDGAGLADLYPPLLESDYMENNFEEVICIIKNGKQGEIVVNGKTYNQLMPPLNMLTDLEIAEIATYIFNNFGHERGLVPVKEVSRLLQNCGEN